MPTSTFLGYDLVNVGPLTTTFTAPSSCMTNDPIMALAERVYPYHHIAAESCPAYSAQGDCVPSGSAIDAISTNTRRTLYAQGWAMPYFSPGLHCPDGYTTAGVAEKSAGGETSVTGLFSVTTFDVYNVHPSPTPFMLPPVNVVASALEEGETAVICCKSGYRADPIHGCYSNYPVTAYTASNYCYTRADPEYLDHPLVNVTFTYNEEVITGVQWSSAASTRSGTSWTLTESIENLVRGDLTQYYTGLTSVQFVTLIHRGSQDAETTGTGSHGTSGAGAAETTGPDEDSGAAHGLRPSWKGVAGVILTAWGVNALVGAVLMV